MLDLFENKLLLNHETTIIGSGFVGLACAAAILEDNPSHKVLILERGLIPTGASTRNAGIVGFGSITEILDEIALMGEKATCDLIKLRYEGILKLRKRLGDENLDFKDNGGYEIITEELMPKLSQMQYVNDLLRPIFKEDVFVVVNGKIEEFGFNKNIVKALVLNKFEGQIDSGKAITSLTNYVQKLGAKIITGAEVVNYAKDSEGRIRIHVRNLASPDETQDFISQNLVICTNAFSQTLIKDADIYPARGQVIVTKPIKDLKLKGAFDYDGGYYYFRDYYGRVLLGGGRNLDIKGETTLEMKTTERIVNRLRELLKEVILPNQDFEIEYEWAGIMCFGTKSKGPIVKKLEDNVFTAIRMSGMGVGLSSQVADIIKTMVFSTKKQVDVKPKL